MRPRARSTGRGSFRAIRILRAGQLVRTLDLYDYLLGGNTRDDIRLERGDVVFVPPRGTNWAGILSGVATILTSALTIVLVVQRL